MGHKVNPIAFRLGQNITWSSKWFAHKNYAELVREDVLIRRYLKKKLVETGIDRIEIERSPAEITINIVSSRPGIIIGRGGGGIEEIKKDLTTRFLKSKQTIKINIQEVVNPNLSAAVMLHNMIADIEKRIPFRRVMKQGMDRIMKAGALGVKVCMSGRLNGVEIARTETLAVGKIPLHTIRANIDYSRDSAKTTYGAVGVKIWLYKGEIFEKSAKKEQTKQF